GHIPGAVNMWFKDVLSDSNLALLPRDKTIVIVCWVGHTASQLVALLGLLGFTVAGLQYGMGESPVPDSPRAGWRDLGLPLEKKIG
ncbi:rhodanese-like domain-containing protein, partial [Frankia casuarinae]